MASSYLKTFKVLIIAVLMILIAILGFMLFGMLLMQFFMALFTVEGFASGVLFFVGAIAVYKIRPSFEDSGVVIGLVCVLVFFGLIFDSSGNAIYNLPLDWWLAPEGGHFQAASHIYHPAPGSTSVSTSYHIVSATGAVVKDVSAWLVYPYRALNYMVVGVLLIFIAQILPPKQTKRHIQLTKPFL